VIDSVKCRAEVEKYKTNYITLVDGTDNVIVDNQHCRLGGMELTVGGLSGWKESVLGSMTDELLGDHTFHNIGQKGKVRDGME